MKKVLVTGAAGFIGSHVVEQLTARGIEVRAAVLAKESTRNIDRFKPEIMRGDILDKAFVSSITEGVDTVFHLAAVYATWMENWRPLWEVNLQGSRNILWACYKSDTVKRVVYTSSLSAIGLKPGMEVSDETTPFNLYNATPYVLSKYLSQQEALGFAQNGLDLVVVNPAFPFGPGDVGPTPTGNIILSMIKGMTRLKLAGGLCAVDVRDVAAGHILAAEKGRTGECYILGNTNLTGVDFCKLVADVLDRHERMISVPAAVMEGGAMIGEWVANNITHKRPMVTVGEIRYGKEYSFMDSSKARNELGYKPRDVRQSIEDAVQWFKDNGYT